MPRTVSPLLAALLKRCLGDVPPLDGLATWEQALAEISAKLGLFFEVSLPTPTGDTGRYLVARDPDRVLVPYLLESATRTGRRPGARWRDPTKVDAILIAPRTGFAVLFEAKVLADASSSVGFDVLRNQLARNIDVMLAAQPEPPAAPLPSTAPRPDLLRAPHPRDFPQTTLKAACWLADALLSERPGCPSARPPHRAGIDLAVQFPVDWDGSPGRLQPAASPRLPMAPRHRQLSAAFARALAGAEILRRCENRQRSFRRGQRCHPASTPGRHQIGEG